MKLIVGLGNPGKEYENTRHNVGFIVVDKFATDKKLDYSNYGSLYYLAEKKSNNSYALLKPLTYMNLSGKAVKHYVNKNDIHISDILVIYDDLALPFGSFKFKPKGGDGGHNGIKSIISELNSQEFPKLRIGIGNNFSKGQMADYVLNKFSFEELTELENLYKNNLIHIINNFLHRGIKGALDYLSKMKNNPAL
mgnify:FL=1